MGNVLPNGKKDQSPELVFCQPRKTPPNFGWDLKYLKKLVNEKKFAPFYPPSETKTSSDMEECPICFLYYPGGLNRSKCCRKGICSDCFIQVKKSSMAITSCPFCNSPRYQVVFTGPMSKEDRDKEEQEEQKVLEARARMQREEDEKERERIKKNKEDAALRAAEAKKRAAEAPQEQHSSQTQPQPQLQPQLQPSLQQPIPTSTIPQSSSNTQDKSHERAVSQSVPQPRQQPPRVVPPSAAHHPSSYPGQGDPGWVDLEEMMVLEAIRLSLADQGMNEADIQKTLSSISSKPKNKEEASMSSEDSHSGEKKKSTDSRDRTSVDLSEGAKEKDLSDQSRSPVSERSPVIGLFSNEKASYRRIMDDDEDSSESDHLFGPGASNRSLSKPSHTSEKGSLSSSSSSERKRTSSNVPTPPPPPQNSQHSNQMTEDQEIALAIRLSLNEAERKKEEAHKFEQVLKEVENLHHEEQLSERKTSNLISEHEEKESKESEKPQSSSTSSSSPTISSPSAPSSMSLNES